MRLPYHHYVLYRLPQETHVNLVAQTHGEPQILTSLQVLSSAEGWVMAPFAPNSEHPTLLLRPDVVKQWPQEALTRKAAPRAKQINAKQERIRYAEAFQHFHHALLHEDYGKLVLSRCQQWQLHDAADPISLFAEACHRYPFQMVALVHMGQIGTWLMATPEVLLRSENNRWHTMALAGTQHITKKQLQQGWENVLWSKKNKEEQQLVTTYLSQALQPFVQQMEQKGPYTTMAAQLLHLRTDFQFVLQEQHLLGALVETLHPTPAVCGLPKEAAKAFITQHEGVDRAYYSGFCGMVRQQGPTHLYVALRCMELMEQHVILHAGGGLLPESNEQSEWEETEAKMATMSALFQRIDT